MQFQVPQFIEVEDKIIGPFTFKQFIYLAGGAGISFVLFKALPIFLSVFFIIPVAALSLALAFYKINGQPFISILESGIKYMVGKKLYTWKKSTPKKKPGVAEIQKKEDEPEVVVPRVTEGKLKDIAWSLGVEESLYAEQDKDNKLSGGNKK